MSTPRIPDSAFVTVGETRATLEKIAAGTAPGAEYAVLSQGHFSSVHAMVDEGLNAGSMWSCARFAFRTYGRTLERQRVYLGEEFPGIQYLAAHFLRRRPRRIVMLIHNVASNRRLLPLATLGLVKQLDHVLCLSERSKQELVSRYRVPATHVSVIGSRVDTRFFQPALSVPVKAQVCSAGAVNRDYQTLIKAGTQLGVPVKIAADTAWAYSVGSRRSPQIPLPPNVEMRSWGTYSNLRQLYAESAMVVVPLARSLLSGVTVALEGMAMGKPVVLTRNPYVEGFLQDGETGYFVQPGDVEGLAKKLRYLLDHPEEAARVGQRARDWVLERFTVQKYVNRILEAFN